MDTSRMNSKSLPSGKDLRPTKGPWAVSLRDGRWCVHRDESAVIAEALNLDSQNGSRSVAVQVVAWMPDDSMESYANAVVMAASLEMKEALRSICATAADIPEKENEMLIASLSKASAMEYTGPMW